MRKTFVTTLLALLFLFTQLPSTNAQSITPAEGFTPQIGTMISMMDDLKGRITRQTRNLHQKGTDFLLDDDANRIGAMILHLAATEKIYQLICFEGRAEFNEVEDADWGAAMSLGDAGREQLVGHPISYYLERWDAVREETKRLLQAKDDEWFASQSKEYPDMNMQWAWFHVMEHQANHMGQIAMIRKRID